MIPRVLILSGPTASGKTDLSLELAKEFSVEIMNADMGQFYQPCTIGTAKPDWQKSPVPHHLFDIIDTPIDMSVSEYRNRVIQLTSQISARGRVPLIVGGSYFYISSLFFPPLPHKKSIDYSKKSYDGMQTEELWHRLSQIDHKRAAQIHINDRYRITRALDLWEQTQELPSKQIPVFDPPFHAYFITLTLPKDVLYERINERTLSMMGDSTNSPWVAECRSLYGTAWESFLRKKGLIGYPELFDWMCRGSSKEEFERLIATIRQATRNYAKRQMTFWRRFRKMLEREINSQYAVKIMEIERIDEENKASMLKNIHEFLNEKISSQ